MRAGGKKHFIIAISKTVTEMNFGAKSHGPAAYVNVCPSKQANTNAPVREALLARTHAHASPKPQCTNTVASCNVILL